MKIKLVALLALGLATACGADKKEDKAPATQQKADQGVNVQSTVDDETAKNLPSMIVAKVPLDAAGNEIVEKGEAREVFGLTTEDGTAAEATFAQGTAVSIADELDRDTSTSQWHRAYYWNTPWYPGKLLGRGLWWGRNPYAYYGGYSYGYRYSSYYNYNNCNYYYYTPSYSSYGYNSYGY